MDPEKSSLTDIEDTHAEQSEEKIHVLIRKDKLVGKLLQFITDNKLHPGFIQHMFNVICIACIPKGMRVDPNQYLFDEEIVDLCLSTLDLNLCPKAPEPIPAPAANTQPQAESIDINSMK